MENPISLQGLQFAAACAAGGLLGVLYDILRALRRRAPALTAVTDILFASATACSLLFLILYPCHGAFRVFLLIGIGLGAWAYFLLPGRLLLPFWGLVWAFLERLLRLKIS